MGRIFDVDGNEINESGDILRQPVTVDLGGTRKEKEEFVLDFERFLRTTQMLNPELEQISVDGPRKEAHYGMVPPVYLMLPAVIPVGKYIGKKLLDVAVDLLKQYLISRAGPCEHRTIPLYGPRGEVVAVVECELKHGPS